MTFNTARNILAIKFYGTEEGKEINKILNEVDENPWHTGTPTDEGWYLFSYKYLDTIRYGTDCFLDGKWVFNPALDEKMLAWKKIEED